VDYLLPASPKAGLTAYSEVFTNFQKGCAGVGSPIALLVALEQFLNGQQHYYM
jgi:hypothetical protein